MRNIYRYIIVIGILFGAGPLRAITLKETPIQSQFATSVASNFDNVSLAAADFSSDEFAESTDSKIKKDVSIVKAGLFSALLPGLGEHYVGHRSKARVFFAVEAATWISFFSFHVYGNWREDDFIEFAAVHANANLEGKSKEFYDWVGFYDDIDQFNSVGRVQDPDRPYLIDNTENHWQWQSSAKQSTYRHLKNRSREAFRRRDFMVGLAIVSRLVSIVDAVRDAKRAQRTIDDTEFSLVGKVNYRIDINPFSNDRPVSMALVTRF